MTGLCKCGGKLVESTHFVKTLEGAKKWIESGDCQLPIKIETTHCESCGRRETVIIESALM